MLGISIDAFDTWYLCHKNFSICFRKKINLWFMCI